MNATLVHADNDYVALKHGDTELFRYVYVSRVDGKESPKPYFHPVRTLAGHAVTCMRPHDHRWHSGLSMTCADLSGQNFWGGPTYVRDEGYQHRDDHGTQKHVGWQTMSAASAADLELVHDVQWIARSGEKWIDEQRRVKLWRLDADAGCYGLDLAFEMTNASGGELEFGSPTTQGRPNAGYGGLFWRGPREWRSGALLGPGEQGGPEIMGQRAPWIAFQSPFDGEDAAGTVVFADHADNPRHPTKWFARHEDYAVISAAFSFDEALILPPGETLRLRYLFGVIDGAWDRDKIERWTEQWRSES